jgi:micrococcal nuclease
MRRVPATAVLLAVLVVLAGCGSTAGPSATATLAGDSVEASVVDVVDGDTLEVRLADGRTDRVRLLGVDTPEVHAGNEPSESEGMPDTDAAVDCLRAAGQNATTFMQRRVLDTSVTLVFDPIADRRGTYDRLLAYVQLDGRDVNLQLIVRGHARLYDSEFSRSTSYAEAEATAQADRRGLWRCRSASGMNGTEHDGPLRLAEIHADAAGDDRENLNDEYLVLENAANRTLDLGGWTLADSAGHTYGFPDGFTLDPGAQVTLRTGHGNDTATTLYWGADGAVWNNGGDTVVVRAANGTVVLDRTYG